MQETVHNECLERHELHEKLEEARDELLELKKNACTCLTNFLNCPLNILIRFSFQDSSQQLIPLKASLNKANFGSYKNGTGLIDVNNPPENYPKAYPKNLNDMISQNRDKSPNDTFHKNRRNSATAPNQSNSGSEKSSAESSAKLVEPFNRNRALALMNNKFPSEPVQLFKKLNELSQNTPAKQKPPSNTFSDNKKRISLLLARKS